MRGATIHEFVQYCAQADFNPRTPCGVRQSGAGGKNTWKAFQSTHPMRGATLKFEDGALKIREDFNPRTPCGVRRLCVLHLVQEVYISIHAPHAGCDPLFAAVCMDDWTFQSTHPMRGATAIARIKPVVIRISIHAPHAGCDCNNCGVCYTDAISIHAPHAGCDP